MDDLWCQSELEVVLYSWRATFPGSFLAEPEAILGLKALHSAYQCTYLFGFPFNVHHHLDRIGRKVWHGDRTIILLLLLETP